MSSFAEMTRPEVSLVLFDKGHTVAAGRAGVVLALMAYAEILADSGPCVTARFTKDRLLTQAMDTLDAFLEEETLRDLGID